MNIEAFIIRHLREGLGVEDIEVVSKGDVSADRARRAINTMRYSGVLGQVYQTSKTTTLHCADCEKSRVCYLSELPSNPDPYLCASCSRKRAWRNGVYDNRRKADT